MNLTENVIIVNTNRVLYSEVLAGRNALQNMDPVGNGCNIIWKVLGQ